ncbi:MAG: hypothetical protein DCC55_35875 [Chloroflexi bacterium]|nr:MAG: hypothetical protein DCC55_35875 [Chloroflexota bacterium]
MRSSGSQAASRSRLNLGWWAAISLAAIWLIGSRSFLQITQTFDTNLGWIYLMRGLYAPPNTAAPALEAAVQYFDRAGVSQAAPRLAEAKGLALIQLGQPEAAASVWMELPAPRPLLSSIAAWQTGRAEWDQALQTWVNADPNWLARTSPIQTRVGYVCQQTLTVAGQLTPANQAICRRYWQANDGNLLVNGTFDAGTLHPWQHHSTAGSDYALETGDAGSPPAARITTRTDGYHGGIFQQLLLPAGATLRFSARVRVAADTEIAFWPLYTRRIEQGEEKIGALERVLVRGQMDWTYYERTFRAPGDSPVRFTAYPLFFRGAGTIWIDDVILRVIDGAEPSQ